MKKKKFVPKSVIDEAKKVDLLTYLQNYEPEELVRVSRNEYATKTHSSLKISNGYWNWCSVGIGGRNAVDFMEKVRNMKFPESAEYVADKMKIKAPIIVEQKEKTKERHLVLPDKNTNEDRVKSYLKHRGIDEEILQKCIEKHLIYEEKNYHNVVFVGYDEQGNAKYAGCRAINESKFKNDATGSDKKYSFRLESNEKTDTIFIFEGAIDLLSYATLFKLYGLNWENKTMISLAGVYQPASNIAESKVPIAIQNYLEKHPEIIKIYLCLDNDIAGRNATKALQMVLPNKYEIIDRPAKKGKDYNEYLCHLLGIKTIKNDKGIEQKALDM
jgi:hypothetical protein